MSPSHTFREPCKVYSVQYYPCQLSALKDSAGCKVLCCFLSCKAGTLGPAILTPVIHYPSHSYTQDNSWATQLYPKTHKTYGEGRISMYQLEWYEKHTLNSQILTGSGLATPILTVPVGAPFSACTASSRLPFSKLISLTNISRSPGRSLPSCSATPPGTNERITITVFAGSTGS